MNDRSKYRAWDKDAEIMVYSDHEEDVYFFTFNPDGRVAAFVITEDAGTIDEPPGPKAVELDDIMQSPGLKDKNGVLIYEGDILRCVDFDEELLWIGIMKYGKFSCGCGDGIYGWYVEGGSIFFDGEYDDPVYIIGNIYKNPDLFSRPSED